MLASKFASLCVGLVLVSLASAQTAAPKSETPKTETPAADKWEKEITAMLAKDEKSPPPKGGIVFTGSSSIRLWDVAKAFPNLPVVNRGFGGSQAVDATQQATKIVTPLQPKLVIFYSGDNDLKANKTPEKVAADFAEFCAVVHKELPKTKIWIIAIKPSPSRWSIYEKQKAANELIRKQCEQDSQRLLYVDIVPAMLGSDGQPPQELFVKDMLHMSPAGYKIWNEQIHKLLTEKKPLE
ncbi:GDSL-type esterase/lipase family protein [Anatilimnocola floriformis]|uniref:GDSL-type esterase/lipase family protein n=1 Tax=Anatilimnocola floriformis TaxID=2948575 RepID=UPI0020C47655|nr:GDSL-type esterase/lipase family protein [Anatilimnocola floriformis]